jgi:hypothetical protein
LSNWYLTTPKKITKQIKTYSTNDLYSKDGNISIKSEDLHEFNLLSLEEARVKHLTNKAKEEKRIEEVNTKKALIKLENKKRLEEIETKNNFFRQKEEECHN